MNRRKLHISPWLLLGTVALLTVGSLLAAVGISFARYRNEQKGNFWIQPEQPAQVYFGTVSGGTFTTLQSAWEASDDQMQLSFAIGNGTAAEDYAAPDQQVRLRIVASLGAWTESDSALYLQVNGQVYTATAQRITEGSVLHSQFGDGWILCFQDENGREPAWDIAGGALNYVQMLLYTETVTDTGLLQLQAVAEVK